jgi:hypothetical protein
MNFQRPGDAPETGHSHLIEMIDEEKIRQRFIAMSPHLDERGRRQFAVVEARLAGYGGIAAVARATGIAPSTIGRGLAELDDPAPLSADRVRRPALRQAQEWAAHRGGARSAAADRSRWIGRARSARRSDVAAALDQQEFAASGGGAGEDGSCDQPYDGRRTVA